MPRHHRRPRLRPRPEPRLWNSVTLPAALVILIVFILPALMRGAS